MRSMESRFAAACAVFVTTVALLSIGPGGDAAMAFGRPGFTHGHDRGVMTGSVGAFLMLLSHLDLTEDQRSAIAEILKGRRDEILSAGRAIAEGRTVLREAVLFGDADADDIRKAASRLGDAIGGAAMLASEVLSEVRQVLTAEQIEQIQALRQARDSAADWLEEMADSMAQE